MSIVGRTLVAVVAVAALVAGIGATIGSAQDTWKECEDAKYKSMKAPAGASAANGKKSADTNCVTCHGASGKGDGAAAAALNPKPADWTSKRVQDESDGELFWKISTGRGAMPSWRHLPDNDRWALIQYIRTLKK